MEEKVQSKKVIYGIKDVLVSIKDLAILEKEKIEEGKYDKVLNQIGNVFQDFKEKSGAIGNDLKEKLAELESNKADLQKRINNKNKEGIWTKKEKEKTEKDFEKLIKKTEELFQNLNEGSNN